MSKYSLSVALLAFVVAGCCCCCWVPTGSFVHSFVLLVSPTSSLSRRPKRHSSRFHIQQEAAAANVFLVRGSSSTVHAGAEELDGETSLTQLLEVAVEAATKAGAIIKQYTDADGSSKVEETYKANSRDLLTIVDPLCETTIRDIVSAAFPTHRFLGEESVPPGKEASTAAIATLLADTNPPSDFLWIVDPIDGTTNFVHGMPLSAPSVAVAYKGEVVAGVIYDPHRDELFTATRGYGAYLNSQPIRVGDARTLSEAVIAMGSPPEKRAWP